MKKIVLLISAFVLATLIGARLVRAEGEAMPTSTPTQQQNQDNDPDDDNTPAGAPQTGRGITGQE